MKEKFYLRRQKLCNCRSAKLTDEIEKAIKFSGLK